MMQSDTLPHIAIIGGGAAGLMCMATLIESHIPMHLIVYEKNKQLGTKVLISGGGRCNVTTWYHRKQDLQGKYIRGRQVIKHAISKFWPRQIMKRFEIHGVPLKIESDMRVFPVSNDGHDIVDVFYQIAKNSNLTKIRYHTSIEDLSHDGTRFVLKHRDEIEYADIVVIATGGNAYRHTGSTGDGYHLAQWCGHHITPLGPSLSSFHIMQVWLNSCSGISFPTARCHRWVWSQTYHADGPILLTHFGISGPLAFVISAYMAFECIDQDHPQNIKLQCFADRNEDRWYKDIQDSCIWSPRKQIKTYLMQYLPERFVIALCQAHTIDVHQIVSMLSKSHKQILSNILGNGIDLTLVGRRAGDEFVTAWGICHTQINPHTLQSTLCTWLYFAGEVMDVDGLTGGYNLTASWTSGRLVAQHIISQINK
jgi:predicted Rossmann fold flavoprotein